MHSIHYCILVNTTILCTTIVFTVEFSDYIQYFTKTRSTFIVAADRLTFFDYLELGTNSKVEDNRRWVSFISVLFISWLPLCCCVPSNAVLVMNCSHQGNRGTYIIAPFMKVSGIETIFWSLVDLLRFKSLTSECFYKIFLLLDCCAAFWFLEHLLHAFLNFVNLHDWCRSRNPLRLLNCKFKLRLFLEKSLILLRLYLQLLLKLLVSNWENLNLVSILFVSFSWGVRYL